VRGGLPNGNKELPFEVPCDGASCARGASLDGSVGEALVRLGIPDTRARVDDAEGGAEDLRPFREGEGEVAGVVRSETWLIRPESEPKLLTLE